MATQDFEDTTLDVEETQKRRVLPWIIGGVLLLLVLGYLGLAWWGSGRVPANATIGGVEVSGSETQAVETLKQAFSDRTSGEMFLAAGTTRAAIDPEKSGLTLDAQASVRQLTGFTVNPIDLWKRLFGSADVDPVTAINTTQLRQSVEAVSKSLHTDPVNGTVKFDKDKVVTTPSVDGLDVDVDRGIQYLSTHWLQDPRPLTMPTTPLAPSLSQEKVDEAKAVAETIVSAPVVVNVGSETVSIPPEGIAAHVSFAEKDNALNPEFDGKGFVDEVIKRSTRIGSKATNASMTIENGVPKVVEGRVGMSIDPTEMSKQMSSAATSTTDRTITMELAETQPEITAADIKNMGVKEVVGSADINLTSDQNRTHNLVLGSQAVNGTLLKPGQTFSLCSTIGGATAAKGYRSAGVIINGVITPEVGGGLSQMATTLYNAAYFSGLQLDAHTAHMFYIPRYPAGREATIYCPSLDMRFTNNTQYGVYIEAWVAGGQTHARFWSTRVWDKVESVSGARRNTVAPTTIYRSGPNCISQSAGPAGFTITVERRMYRGGVVAKQDSATTVYQPENAYVCR